MINLSVIILTRDEKLHIRRCIERLMPLEPRRVFVVDCFSTDGTRAIVESFASKLSTSHYPLATSDNRLPTSDYRLATNISVFEHAWPGNQATQFNWALDNLPIETEWILRLDADEYLTQESIEWLKGNLDSVAESVVALEFTLERKFMGGTIRRGTNSIPMVRMFRRGHGRYADTLMDERIVFDGKKLSVPMVFYDDNLNTLSWWKEKHRDYAKREAEQVLSVSFPDSRKAMYYRLPPYFRAFAYFCYRYVFRLGFLDGYAGWMWHFWQGLWYRWLVDIEIGKLRQHN